MNILEKAMSKANRRYPSILEIDDDAEFGEYDINEAKRNIFIEGYEQAKKNAIERAVAWLDEHFIDDSFNSDRGYYGKMETYDFDTMAEMRESFIKAMEEE